MPVVACQRCSRKVAKGVVCSYCNRFIGFECLKAQKKVKDRHILHLYICKDCWNISSYRKMYKRNVPKSYLNFEV